MRNLKSNTNESLYKTEIDSQTQKANLWLPKGKVRRGGINQEYGTNIQTTMHKIINRSLLYSTENYIQYLVITYDGKESEKYISKTESLCCTPESKTLRKNIPKVIQCEVVDFGSDL